MNKRPPPAERPAALPIIVPAPRPRLVLRPAAFLKLTYLCHAADTEIGGFGLSSADDALTIEDVLIVRQTCTAVTVEFDDEAVADLIDTMADAGVAPNRCSRVWVHTHPGASASPSGTDERTFARSFGGADFSVMLILARGGAMYARLQLIGTVKTAVEIPVLVDWSNLPDWLDAGRQILPDQVERWASELNELVATPVPQAFFELGDAMEDRPVYPRLPPYAGQDWFEQQDAEDEFMALYEGGADERDYGF